MNAPKKSLGQHFLINKKALATVAESLAIHEGMTVIEIGPGHGELTDLLIASPAEKIIAIEKDHELAEILKEKYATLAGRIEIVEGDALKDLARIAENVGAPYVLAGNIPYYITGHLLRIIGELGKKPVRAVLTMQKEVALRVCAVPRSMNPVRDRSSKTTVGHLRCPVSNGMNRLAACVQAWGAPRIAMTLAPVDFDPPPTIDSAIIAIETMPDAPERTLLDAYYKTTHILFQQPRKTVLNNLAHGLSLDKEAALALLKKAGLSGTERPENLGIATILEISRLSTD